MENDTAKQQVQSKKKLVPLEEYLSFSIVKTVFRGAGSVYLLLSIFGGVLGVLCVLLSLCWLLFKGTVIPILIPGLVVTVTSCVMYLISKFMLKEAKNIGNLELITAEKLKNLPVEEALMRSSSRPTPEQEDVLLRPASSVESAPHEQLLRADLNTQK